MMQVIIEVLHEKEGSRIELTIPETMQAELRLLVARVAAEGRTTSLAEVFGRMCSLGIDYAMSLYSKRRLRAMETHTVVWMGER